MASGSSSDVHTVTTGSISFTVDRDYRPLRLLGQGAYGAVCAATLSRHGMASDEQVAIKKIAGVFNEATSNVSVARRTLCEMTLMRQLQHENLMRIRDLMLSPDGHDAYLVSDCMATDLANVIRSPEPLSSDHCCWFVYQLLCGIKYLHSAHVIHRDLKPSNLLVNANCDLKISDFGLARTETDESGPMMTQYVVTRWYRAPEILLLVSRYTKAVDLWSVGCIFAGVRRAQASSRRAGARHRSARARRAAAPPGALPRAQLPQPAASNHRRPRHTLARSPRRGSSDTLGSPPWPS